MIEFQIELLFLRLCWNLLIFINNFLQINFIDVNGHTVREKEWPINRFIRTIFCTDEAYILEDNFSILEGVEVVTLIQDGVKELNHLRVISIDGVEVINQYQQFVPIQWTQIK